MLTIGILNNMPQAAVRSTERQFTQLLTEAALDIPLEIKWLSLFPRDGYACVDTLWEASCLDGLIATGTEPRAYRLNNEPYWHAFARTVEWASRHTVSTIWSCLAAHAAVYYIDGIERQPLQAKLHGVFAITRKQHHVLLEDVQGCGIVPHSRWNGLPLEMLRKKEYHILTQGHAVGADLFVKPCGRSLFVFLQGHPEYDKCALMREYRRDLLRFLGGERADYPALPVNYFDARTENRLRVLRRRSLSIRDLDLGMLAFQEIIDKAVLAAGWKISAGQLYRNWIGLLMSQRASPMRSSFRELSLRPVL